MATATTYPGVYIEEVPSGVRTITGVATSIAAFVGYTGRGVVNKAVRVQSFADFERAFGGLQRDAELGYAVQAFFLNGGTDAYVVRVAQGATAAEVTLKYGPGGTDRALVVRAANEGAWGNGVRLDVDYATSNPDSTFNLKVTPYDATGTPQTSNAEQFRNLSMSSHSPTYALSVVNDSSKLIRLDRAAGLTFANTDRGFSLSSDLSTFPSLTAQDKVVEGVLDGVDAFTLTLTPAPTDLPDLVTSLNAKIGAAGLGPRLVAKRADATGADAAAGNFLKLESQLVAANPNTASEFSSVQIRSAPANDLAAKLGLGLANGGREWEGGRFRRPLPTGTRSADLADRVGANVNGAINVEITDNATTPPRVLLPATALTPALPATPVGPELAQALEPLIRNLGNPAARNATVSWEGTYLRVAPSADSPGASIAFTGAGAGAGQTRLGVADAFVNVQQYRLGTGVGFGAERDASAGADGTPPDGPTLIGNEAAKTGMYALLDVDLFNLMAIPLTARLGAAGIAVIQEAIALCERRRAFFIVDPDRERTLTNVATWANQVGSSANAAVYFPRVLVADPLDQLRVKPMEASGSVAGLYARTDTERGVWKAPAGIDAVIRGAQGLNTTLTDRENGILNPLGVNSLRTFPVYGTVVWGARTMRGADAQASEWKYIPIRRLALFLEESLYRGTQWVVFEPNDEPLWAQIRANVGAFMHNLFRQGAFQGTSPREAYFVKCDRETTTQEDRDLGIVNILVGFAPLKPAEFVIIKIQQIAGQPAA